MCESCKCDSHYHLLSNDVFEQCTSTGSGLFLFLNDGFAQSFSQIVSTRVKKLSNTIFKSSRHIKGEKASLPVYVRRSKTPLLKLPIIIWTTTSPHLRNSEIREIFTFGKSGIQGICLGESKIPLKIGNPNASSTDKESGIRDVGSRIQGLSWISWHGAKNSLNEFQRTESGAGLLDRYLAGKRVRLYSPLSLLPKTHVSTQFHSSLIFWRKCFLIQDRVCQLTPVRQWQTTLLYSTARLRPSVAV